MTSFADFVAEVMSAEAPAGQGRCLLIDAAATHGTNVARETGHIGTCIEVLTNEPCMWTASAGPVLMPLPEQPLTAFRATRMTQWLSKWRYANCVSLIETPLTLADLSDALKARTEAVLPDDMAVVLRFFDGRVLPELLKVLSAADRASFLGCVTRWSLPDRRGELIVLTSADASRSAVPFCTPLKLNEQQQAALIDAGEADAVIDVLLNEGDATLVEMLPPDQHDAVSAALVQAREMNITEWGDQLSFSSLSLSLGASFYRDEPWASLMAQVRSGTRRLGDVVIELSQTSKP